MYLGFELWDLGVDFVDEVFVGDMLFVEFGDDVVD